MARERSNKARVKKEKEISERILQITESILEDYRNGRDIDNMDVFSQPDNEAVIDIVQKLLNILYPGYYREKNYRSYNDNSRISILIEDVVYNLTKQIAIALRFRDDYAQAPEDKIKDTAEDIAVTFISRIPKIREYSDTDMEAFYQGDPAAYNKEEIVLCYPGLLAVTVNRLAHELFLLKVPLIPRIMTEYAHSRTGIDIHPGATIGKYFFMDHGTGIVVGETSVIGEHVKIYQGVTIGALSTKGGQSLRGVKRHPTIEDHRGQRHDLRRSFDPRRRDRDRRGVGHRLQRVHHEQRPARHQNERQDAGTCDLSQRQRRETGRSEGEAIRSG